MAMFQSVVRRMEEGKKSHKIALYQDLQLCSPCWQAMWLIQAALHKVMPPDRPSPPSNQDKALWKLTQLHSAHFIKAMLILGDKIAALFQLIW